MFILSNKNFATHELIIVFMYSRGIWIVLYVCVSLPFYVTPSKKQSLNAPYRSLWPDETAPDI